MQGQSLHWQVQAPSRRQGFASPAPAAPCLQPCKRARRTTAFPPVASSAVLDAAPATATLEHRARLGQDNGQTAVAPQSMHELPLVDPEALVLPAGELSVVDRDSAEVPADVFRCSDCTNERCQVKSGHSTIWPE